MPDNLLVAYLPDFPDIPNASIRFQIYDADRTATNFTPIQHPVGSGTFLATFTGAAGRYDGIVQILTAEGWVSTGQQLGPFQWSGTEFVDTPDLAPVLGAIAALPEPLDATATTAATAVALAAFPVAKPEDVAVAVEVDGGFGTGDAAALAATAGRVLALSKRQGLEPGVSATVRDAAPDEPGSLTTSDEAIAQTLTLNEDGSMTIENTPD